MLELRPIQIKPITINEPLKQYPVNSNSSLKPVKWSASRVGTYCDCKLKYKYNYIEKWKSSDTLGNEFAEKGLCFHETAELYTTNTTDEDCYKILNEKITEHSVDVTKYPEKQAVGRFIEFWKMFVAPVEKEGYEVKKESWVNGVIDGNNFCGALDLLLENCILRVPDTIALQLIGLDKAIRVPTVEVDDLNRDMTIQIKPEFLNDPDIVKLKNEYKGSTDKSSVIIYDYKTCTTIAASKYKNQQVLYAYLKGQEHGWSNEEIVKRVKLNIFFPFGKSNDMLPIDMQAKTCTKELKYTVADIEAVINDHFLKNINESKQMDWSTITPSDGTVSFGCKFCQYLGSIPDPNTGFQGCMASFNQGYLQKRGVTFTKET